MRFPWQPKQPPLALRIARTLERRGVGIEGLAVETHRGRATLRGVVTSDLAHDRAVEIARSVEGVERIDDLLSVVDPQTVRPRRKLRHEDCTAVYITQPGDTLAGIAERVLGERRRWRELRDANRKVVGTGPALAPGLKLSIPKGA
jgi:nucleoid-associated protein YgaU